MNKRDKAIIKLLGVISAQLVMLATNLSTSNSIKTTVGARRTNMIKYNSKVMIANLDMIDKIIKEAIDD